MFVYDDIAYIGYKNDKINIYRLASKSGLGVFVLTMTRPISHSVVNDIRPTYEALPTEIIR